MLQLYRRLTEISGGDTISSHDLALVAEAEGFAVGKPVQASAQQARAELEGLQVEWQRRQEYLKREIMDLGQRCVTPRYTALLHLGGGVWVIFGEREGLCQVAGAPDGASRAARTAHTCSCCRYACTNCPHPSHTPRLTQGVNPEDGRQRRSG